MLKSGKLSDFLSPKENNTDLIRLFLSLMVIYGHATTISPQAGYVDFFEYLIGVNSSSVAVWIFFFLSGLLITNSLIVKRNITIFIVARFFRIWPALFVLIFITSYVLGPLLSRDDLSVYFGNTYTHDYFLRNIRLAQQYFLPGVFTSNPYREMVNGSLWSIPYEIYAYFILLVSFFFGILNKWSILVFIFVVGFDFISPFAILSLDRGAPLYLLFSFSLGVFFTLWADKVMIDIKKPLIFIFGYIVLGDLKVAILMIQVSIFYFVLWLSIQKWFLTFKPKHDLSYGVYLWGFFIAQILVMFFPGINIYYHQFFSICISLIFAYFSCILVERPCVRLGFGVGNLISKLFNKLKLKMALL